MRFFAVLLAALAFAGAAHAQRADPLHEAAESYAFYQSDVSALLGVEITSAEHLDWALERVARHDPARVARGWIAYGALTAAQSRAFVRGVRGRVSAAGRAPVLRQLRRDITYARRRPQGSGDAIQLMLNATQADAARLLAAGERYEAIARSIENAAWIAPPADARAARDRRLRSAIRDSRDVAPALASLVRVAPLGADPDRNAEAFGGRGFWDAIAGRTTRPPAERRWREASGRGQSVDPMLTLGALFAIDATRQERSRVNDLLDAPAVRECLEMEQLQLRQCASVAHFSQEDAYCLARHGLTQPGACFSAVTR